ncbi:hypothetical protein L6452_34204 [Arctium lappa]|uniref:Uncharacterized protein n=1 Tax=Arctium lappa TaxID=4217 RepID=A0ACB8YGU6_ARCLA|nr:hypothetical protein L6452_34204 [Arctium lappa]
MYASSLCVCDSTFILYRGKKKWLIKSTKKLTVRNMRIGSEPFISFNLKPSHELRLRRELIWYGYYTFNLFCIDSISSNGLVRCHCHLVFFIGIRLCSCFFPAISLKDMKEKNRETLFIQFKEENTVVQFIHSDPPMDTQGSSCFPSAHSSKTS